MSEYEKIIKENKKEYLAIVKKSFTDSFSNNKGFSIKLKK